MKLSLENATQIANMCLIVHFLDNSKSFKY